MGSEMNRSVTFSERQMPSRKTFQIQNIVIAQGFILLIIPDDVSINEKFASLKFLIKLYNDICSVNIVTYLYNLTYTGKHILLRA